MWHVKHTERNMESLANSLFLSVIRAVESRVRVHVTVVSFRYFPLDQGSFGFA